MAKFLGNCNDHIDWDKVLNDVEQGGPAYIGPRHTGTEDLPGMKEVFDSWQDAGFVNHEDGGSTGWGMYFPGQHFDAKVVETFENIVGINTMNAWISKVYPGMIAPWHWDVNDNEEYYAQFDIRRYSVHICKPDPGHVFMVEDTCMYNRDQGDIFEWPSRKSWHGGANFGFAPKYLFNVFGTPAQ